jgi:hypothetical protein
MTFDRRMYEIACSFPALKFKGVEEECIPGIEKECFCADQLSEFINGPAAR